MVLSNKQVKDARADGRVHIHPFEERFLNNASYDFSLHHFVWRHKRNVHAVDLNDFDPLNIYELRDLRDTDGRLHLAPGECVLAATQQFIGTRRLAVPSMAGKSRSARLFIALCGDGGWGDVGYATRWTIEIKNGNPFGVSLAVGSVIGQIIFDETGPILPGTAYWQKGSFAPSDKEPTQEEMEAAWHPEMMLPKPIPIREEP